MDSSLTTQDHYTILRWANTHGGEPARVRQNKGRKAATLAITFPQHDRREHIEPISWHEFFRTFEAEQLELTYEVCRDADSHVQQKPLSTLLPRIIRNHNHREQS